MNVDTDGLTKEWLSYIKLRRSPTTYGVYRSVVYSFIDSLPTGILPVEVQTTHIEIFLQHIAENYKISTANTYLMIVKSFYGWAKTYHGLDNAAAPVTKLRAPRHLPRILTDDEYRAVLQVTKGVGRDAIQFLGNTGLRRNEFRGLRWRDFRGGFVHVTGKGHKDRQVPLNDVCKRIIGTNLDGDIPPFVLPFQSYHPIYRLCAGVSRQAGISYFTPHSLRHYFATRLIRAGVSLIIVSKILGHADTQITERIYVHLIPADLRVTGVLDF